jgi:PRTRC genetic system protein B
MINVEANHRHNEFPHHSNQIEVVRPSHPITECAIVFTQAGKLTLTTRHLIFNGKLGRGKPVDGQHILEEVVSENRRAEREHNEQGIQRGSVELIPNTVLYDSSKTLVWYKKAQQRMMWFRVGKTLQLRVWWSTVLFVVNRTSRSLSVFALARNTRPTLDTKLYRAPFMNIDGTGDFCFGSATLPKDLSANNITEIEQCLYDSNFTHLNDESTGHILFSNDTAHLKFWRSQQKQNAKIKVTDLPYICRLSHINFNRG